MTAAFNAFDKALVVFLNRQAEKLPEVLHTIIARYFLNKIFIVFCSDLYCKRLLAIV